MAKFHVHPSADIRGFQHGISPTGSGDSHQHRLGAELRMARYERLALAAIHQRVAAVLSLNLERGRVRKLSKVNTPLDFRLHDPPVYLIAQIGMGQEVMRAGIAVLPVHRTASKNSITRMLVPGQ